MLSNYTYIFVIGTFFALLDAFNNGANDVANAWATSVSSRSISYRWAMVLATVFELLGALTVGARTADTIKNGIIPLTAFQNNAGVQMLAFTCALGAASSWVMWCTRHSTHVSSTYSLISGIAGVGVALVGARGVSWGWNSNSGAGAGLGAIFAGLLIAPACAGGFGAVIYMLIKTIVLWRKNPSLWAVYTAPFFVLITGTVCTLSIVYKGSPSLNLQSRPGWFIAATSLGVGFGLALLAAIFFVPFLHAKVIKRDASIKWYHIFFGPALWRRVNPNPTEQSVVPNFAVVQHDEQATAVVASTLHDDNDYSKTPMHGEKITDDSSAEMSAEIEANQASYKELMAAAQEKFHAKLRERRNVLGWAMRRLHDNQIPAGEIYELKVLGAHAKRLPAIIVCGALYGMNYDIHAMQSGVHGTPEARRMERVYANAKKYDNESEYAYSFIQIISASTASFAHGANDIGNAVAPWSVIYSAWSTGQAAASKNPVALWQIAVVGIVLCIGFITYGYNIMRIMGNKLTYHSPSRGTSMELGAALAVLVFSLNKLPVSTSMCITGATVGVGLCNGHIRAVNWHRVGLLFISWILTIPIAGLLGGISMGIILNAPRFGLAN